jgi:hypothetical protein
MNIFFKREKINTTISSTMIFPLWLHMITTIVPWLLKKTKASIVREEEVGHEYPPFLV